MGEEPSRRNRVVALIVASLLLALLAFEITALILWVPGSWNARLSAVLAIIGVYGLAIGFVSGNATLAVLQDELKDFTSPGVLKYMASNFGFLAILSSLVSLSGGSKLVKGYPVALVYLGKLLYLVWAPVFLAYAAFHIFIVMVLSYLPVLLASAVTAPIIYSSGDIAISIGQKRILVSNIVKKDPVAFKGFLIGIPAVFISLLSAISAPFLS